MPTILRWKGYRFFFFSNEGSPIEPCHIHAAKGDAYVKIWLEPEVAAEEAYNLTSAQIHEVVEKVKEEKERITRCWNEYFNKS